MQSFAYLTAFPAILPPDFLTPRNFNLCYNISIRKRGVISMSKKQNIKETVIKSDKVTYGAAVYNYSLIMRESRRVASYRIPHR